jgi:cob(I)alamin adenosyltransferase
MKIYTGTGDGGKTSLFSGERISKNDARIEAYGVVDELNSSIGAIIAFLPSGPQIEALHSELTLIQSNLFRVGAWLATTADSPSATYLQAISEHDIQELEEQIDRMQSILPALKEFILPGGHPSAAWSHIARTVCRRAERQIVSLIGQSIPADDGTYSMLMYINRLSDYFFVMARYCNYLSGMEDQAWRKPIG